MGRPLEIACDESGYEGEKLIGSTTAVFAHGSVRLDHAAAADVMQELRNRIRSPATEYKANHVLRAKHRAVLAWLLGTRSPLRGHARVYLVDKAYYVLGKLVDLLVADRTDIGLRPDGDTRDITATLYRDGRALFGGPRWEAFLLAANELMRPRSDGDGFFEILEQLYGEAPTGPVQQALGRLRPGRARAAAFRARAPGDPLSALDPLVPAIRGAVLGWGGGSTPVTILHDRQNMLPAGRIAALVSLLDGRLAGLSLVDSFTTPTVQVADVLAGTVRKVAEDELRGEGDPALTAQLAAFVDPTSIWGDERSWTLIRPTSRRAPRQQGDQQPGDDGVQGGQRKGHAG